MKKNEIQNNLFGNVNSADMRKIQNKVVSDSRIRLCSTLMTPSREIVPIAEALVAFDPTTDTIVKFISAFIPQPKDKSHKGIKYLISKHAETGEHKPVVIAWNGQKKEGSFWNPHFLTAHLDYSKLPMTNENTEFRIFRTYRAGIRVPARFELLKFNSPEPGQDVDKRTLRVEAPFNSVPPIQLTKCYKNFFWWQKQIINQLGIFAGVDLCSALGLGIKRKLDQAVQKGEMTPEVQENILHDHSEDPVEVSEPLSASFGLGKANMVEADEGQDFYVPVNPMLQTMPHKETEEETEEETVELFD